MVWGIYTSLLGQQYVTIPDSNFNAFLKKKYPQCYNKAGQLDNSCTSIRNETILNVSRLGIKNLSGIEYFTSLEYLNCNKNYLESLPPLPDNLKDLNCQYNFLTSLPTLPSKLQNLECQGNLLTILPVLPYNLRHLYCDENKLTALPKLDDNYMLETVSCDYNQLTVLPSWFPTRVTSISFIGNKVKSFDNIYVFDIRSFHCDNNLITSLPYFLYMYDSLRVFTCSGNFIKEFMKFDNPLLSPFNDSLEVLDCSNNELTSLPILPPKLKYLDASYNCFQTIPQNPNPSYLKSFNILPFKPKCTPYVQIPDSNFCKELRSKFPSCMYQDHLDTTCSVIKNVKYLDLKSLKISNLSGIEYFEGLEWLNCNSNNLKSLPVLPKNLKELYCDNNFISSIYGLPKKLRILSIENNHLASLPELPVSLRKLSCNNNQLTLLTHLPDSISELHCRKNQLNTITNLPNALIELECNDNQLSILPDLPNSLRSLYCFNNKLTTLTGSLDSLDLLRASYNCFNPVLGNTNPGKSRLFEYLPNNDSCTNLTYVDIPDSNFRSVLMKKFPKCFDTGGRMQTTCPAITVTEGLYVGNSNISNLEGIQYFHSLLRFDCSYNNLESLPTLPNKLVYLNCGYNKFENLPLLPEGLLSLDCVENDFKIFPDLSKTHLTHLVITNNNFTELPFSSLPKELVNLDARYNCFNPVPVNENLPTLHTFNVLPNHPKCTNDIFVSLTLGFADVLRTIVPNCIDDWINMDTTCSDLRNVKKIEIRNAFVEDIKGIQYFKSLDSLICNYCGLVDLPKLPEGLKYLDARNNCFPDSMMNPNPTILKEFIVEPNRDECLIPKSLFYIPDPSFRAILKEMMPLAFYKGDMLDTLSPYVVYWQYLDMVDKGISSLEGVQYFKNLELLFVPSNNLTELPKLAKTVRALKADDNCFLKLPVVDSTQFDYLVLTPNKVGCVVTDVNKDEYRGRSEVFPNPAHDKLTVVVAMGTEQIQIYNATGQLLIQRGVSGTVDLDISNLQTGIYYYYLGSKKGTLLVE